MTEITLLKAEDIADAVLYALSAPLRVNIGLIVLPPTEQIPGGLVSPPPEALRYISFLNQ